MKLRDVILLAERLPADLGEKGSRVSDGPKIDPECKAIEDDAHVVCAMVSSYFRGLKIETPDFWRICVDINHREQRHLHNQTSGLGTLGFYIDVDIVKYRKLNEEEKFRFLASLIISVVVEVLDSRKIETNEVSNIYEKLDFDNRYCEYHDRGAISPDRSKRAFLRVRQHMAFASICVVIRKKSKVIFEKCIDKTSPNPFAFTIYFDKLVWKSDELLVFESDNIPNSGAVFEIQKFETRK